MGRRHSTASFVLLVRPGQDVARTRLGITASRRVGNAIVRNRIRRRVREWFRQSGQSLLPGLDVVVIARAAAGGLRGSDTFAELSRIARGVR
jgi:ribonuclease P protein component